jgi:Ran GTPase-activating protein (RanGAP) involved in mRNA processing and transport
MLVKNNALQKLGLQTNLVGIEGACAIAKGLQNNSCLKSLSLCRNGICDSGAFALAEVLTQKLGDFLLVNKTLESLDVEFNAISHAGKQALINAKSTNKNWKVLKIENYKTAPVDHSYESANLVYTSRPNYRINICSVKSNII